MIRCVLFDLDGTLIDTWRLYLTAYRHTLASYLGYLPSEQDIIALKPGSERDVLQKVVGEEHIQAYSEKFLVHCGSFHDTLFEGPYPGILDMLKNLRGQRYLLGIVTGKSRGAWTITSSKSNLGSFEVVVTDDEVKNPKPSPEGTLLALSTLGLSPSQALYIGDSLADLEAAQAAKVLFGAAVWPKGRNEREKFITTVKQRGAWACFPNPVSLVESLRG